MANLFQKNRALFAVLGGLFIIVVIVIIVFFVQDQTANKLSTPDLIQQAFARGEITDEERLLYLAYALGDSEKLPARYISKAPWSGTMIGLELHETVRSKEEMCRLSPLTQSELQRVLKIEGVACDN